MKRRVGNAHPASAQGKTMKTLKVLSALLSYPQPEMQAALDEMTDVLERENLLPEREQRLVKLAAQFRGPVDWRRRR